jgi:hypothetical protein
MNSLFRDRSDLSDRIETDVLHYAGSFTALTLNTLDDLLTFAVGTDIVLFWYATHNKPP